MPGTFQGTDEEWAELEAPFAEIDPKLNIYALANGLDLFKNQSDRPGRTIEWYKEGMERRATIVAQGGSPPTFALWATAARKVAGRRLTARRPVGQPIGVEHLQAFAAVLEEAMKVADEISRSELTSPTD